MYWFGFPFWVLLILVLIYFSVIWWSFILFNLLILVFCPIGFLKCLFLSFLYSLLFCTLNVVSFTYQLFLSVPVLAALTVSKPCRRFKHFAVQCDLLFLLFLCKHLVVQCKLLFLLFLLHLAISSLLSFIHPWSFKRNKL